MKEEYFVNSAFEEALELYLSSLNNKDSITYNSFLVITIRILVLIYGELDILNPYYLKNSVALINNLGKYGLSKSDIALFKDELLNYTKIEQANSTRKIKLKNPHLKNVLKYLVDMFVAKKKNGLVSFQEEEEFLELAYTSHTKNPYRVSYSYMISDDLNYIEKYYYSKLNSLEMTRELSKTITNNINLEALGYIGVNLSNLKNMSSKEIEKAKSEAYNYFEIDADSPSRDHDLQQSVNYYKTFGHKFSTGNGYVDILLLMSVIVTSLSVIAILFFSLM